MVWFVALVAVLNLGLGYAVAVYVGAARAKDRPAPSVAGSGPSSDREFGDSDDYYSDEQYDEAAENEYEAATAE